MIEFRVGKLAEKLRVHRNTVSNWIKNGHLQAVPTVGKRYLIERKVFIRFCRRERIDKRIIDEFDNSAASGTDESEPEPDKPENNPATLTGREVRMTDKTIGSVMVVGGGIAGIQATLDLADAGFQVCLVEKSAGIGGAMAQLDKTFPTNDCAM